jgi:disaggregatase-related protein
MTCKNVSYCRGFAIGGPEGSAQYNRVYNNFIKDTTVRNQINGDHNFIFYNVIDTITNVPYRTYGTAHALSLEGYAGYACHDNQIFNNVIYSTDEPGIWVAGYGGASNKENNLIQNNIFYNTGKNSKEGFTGYGLIVNDHPTVKRNIYQNNNFHKPGVTNIISYRGTPKTISDFNKENGRYDTISGNIQSNPLFIDPSHANFKLQAQSLSIDAGLDTDISWDYAGQPVPQGARADIGAFEYPSPTKVTQNAQRK